MPYDNLRAYYKGSDDPRIAYAAGIEEVFLAMRTIGQPFKKADLNMLATYIGLAPSVRESLNLDPDWTRGGAK